MNEREIMRMLRAAMVENSTKAKVAVQLLSDVADDIGSNILKKLSDQVGNAAQAEMFRRQYHDSNRG